MSARVWLGTQGWSYDDWKDVFYPPGSRQEDRLPFYSRVFDSVELDTTFYHAPRGTIARSWARSTPADFRFTAKVPRAITHDAKLAGMGEALVAFARSLEPLGEKLGPVLVQMPAEFVHGERAQGDLDRLLAGAPAGLRLAVEFRHVSWQRPDVTELLRRRGASRVWAEWRDLPRSADLTADFLYVRWLGDRRELAKYDRVQIDRAGEFTTWEVELRRVLPEIREVFGYFNNHWAGHSPASANEMKRRLGLPFIEPRDCWSQRELF